MLLHALYAQQFKNMSNVIMKEQCHPEANDIVPANIMWYIGPVAQHTGKQLLFYMTPAPPPPLFNWGKRYK